MKQLIALSLITTIIFFLPTNAMRRFKRSQNKGNETPTTRLVNAAGTGNLKKMRKSIEEGAKVDGIRMVQDTGFLAALRKSKKTETTAVFKAIEKKRWEAVAFLIHQGASVNQTNKNGQTPLHCALDNNRSDLVKLLCEGGANMSAQDTEQNTPFHVITQKKPDWRPVLAIESKMINQLLHAVLFKPINEEECTPGSSQELKELLTARAQKLKELLEVKNSEGKTAYQQLSDLRKNQPKARLIDPQSVEPDLQKFLIALHQDETATVPFNNIFKAAYDIITLE